GLLHLHPGFRQPKLRLRFRDGVCALYPRVGRHHLPVSPSGTLGAFDRLRRSRGKRRVTGGATCTGADDGGGRGEKASRAALREDRQARALCLADSLVALDVASLSLDALVVA